MKQYAWIAKLKGIKNIEIILTVAVLAVILLVYFTSRAPQTQVPTQQNTVVQGEETDEQKLQRVLSAIKGAGDVQVMITYVSSPERVMAEDTDENINSVVEASGTSQRTTTNTTQNKRAVTVQRSGGAEAIILKEIKPEVKGVIVVAQGAGNISVQLDLIRAVSACLGVAPSKVEIFAMEAGGL